MKKDVLLSVIIPCYNNGNLLHEMIDCILNQTFKDWELIVVDDGSTDDTFEKAKAYTENDERIKVIQRYREPKGSVVCRNIGFEMSSGKYIIHFDADDLCSPTCFEKRVLYMESHPEYDYATFTAQSFVLKNGEVSFEDKGFYGNGSVEDLLGGFLSVHYPFSIWCNIYRRQSITNYPWDEKVKVYSDFSYALPMIFMGLNHSYSPDHTPDYYYRRFYSTSNMCASAVNEDKCKSTLYLFDKVLRELELRADSDKRKEHFLRFIVLHFERLVNGNSLKDVEDYIHMVSKHYPETVIDKMKIISQKCFVVSNSKYRLIRLNRLLFHHFRYPVYRTQYIHSVAKFLLRK